MKVVLIMSTVKLSGVFNDPTGYEWESITPFILTDEECSGMDYVQDGVLYTRSASLADEVIRSHYNCLSADRESSTFFCYNCNAGIKWVG